MITKVSQQSSLTETNNSSKYNQQIDIMKGLAILLVVAGHIIQFSVEGGGKSHPTYLWIYKFHMDVFFFCSGFVFHGIELHNTIFSSINIIKKKCVRLLLPFLVWSIIILIKDDKTININSMLEYMWVSPKYGLWFLKSLLKYSIIITIFYYIFSKICLDKKVTELLILLLLVCYCLYTSEIHFLFFILGLLFCRKPQYKHALSNKYIVGVSSIVFLSSMFISNIPNYVVALSSITFFYNIGSKINYPQIIKKQACLLGKNSMPIFVLHFFIVLEITLYTFTQPIVLFCEGLILAVIISYICLLIYFLINVGLIPLLLFGEKFKQN